MIINNLTFKYKNKRIFDNFNYEFQKNNIYLLIGKNGSGKTTLLKIISGLIKKINNQNNVFFVCDSFNYPNHLTSFEYLNLFHKDKIKIYYYLKLFDVPNIKIKKMSKGMQQKLNLIISLLIEKEILLYDEVESFIDKESFKIFIKEIVKIDKTNKIIIFSTHNINKYNTLGGTKCYLD